MTTTPEHRFFYHSFPRRGRGTDQEISIGCAILSLIRNAGLVLAPEVVTWKYPHADGTPPRQTEILQQRVCFTELRPDELAGHAEKFGRFALEFTIPTLKALGAIPVFYIPRAQGAASGAESVGDTLVIQLIDAMILVTRIAEIRRVIAESGPPAGIIPCEFGFKETGNRKFDLDVGELLRVTDALTYAITPPDMLMRALEGVQRFFYPADDEKRDEILGYYREREWRIAGNIAIRGEEIMRLPSPEIIDRLVGIDPEFYGREFPPNTGKRLAESILVLPGIEAKRLVQFVNRIIVPEEAIDKVAGLFKGEADAPPIVALESLVRAP